MEQRFQRPVLDRLKCANLALALHNQPQRHRLHAARRKPAPHFVPQQRRNLIAHQAIEHAPRLLRVHKILIDIARMLECFLHGLLRDLVEGDAANLFSLFGVGAQVAARDGTQSPRLRGPGQAPDKSRRPSPPASSAAPLLFLCPETRSAPAQMSDSSAPRRARSWADP